MAAREEELPSDALMRGWLSAFLCGCHFSPILARVRSRAIRYRTVLAPTDDTTAAILNAAMDDAEHERKAIVLTFPLIRNGAEVAALLATLAKHPRWDCTELPPPEQPKGVTRVAVTWLTPSKQRSRVMGLAPFGTMPVTRRAPFVAIAAWPGGHENPWRQPDPKKPPRNFVTFSDMPVRMTKKAHDELEAKSQASTQGLVGQAAEDAPGYKLTFQLESAAREILFASR